MSCFARYSSKIPLCAAKFSLFSKNSGESKASKNSFEALSSIAFNAVCSVEFSKFTREKISAFIFFAFVKQTASAAKNAAKKIKKRADFFILRCKNHLPFYRR